MSTHMALRYFQRIRTLETHLVVAMNNVSERSPGSDMVGLSGTVWPEPSSGKWTVGAPWSGSGAPKKDRELGSSPACKWLASSSLSLDSGLPKNANSFSQTLGVPCACWCGDPTG